MIRVSTVETRYRKLPGKPAVSVIHRTNLVNDEGTNTVTVLEGNKVISKHSEKIRRHTARRIHNRKFVKGLYKGLQRRTRRHLRSKSKAHLFL
jgi:hypothetical protein